MYLRLWNKLSKRRKIHLVFLLLLTVMSSFAEVISLGVTVPFLAMLVSPQRVSQYIDANVFLSQITFLAPQHRIVSMTVIFAICIVLAGVLRLASLRAGIRMAQVLGSEISNNIYKRILYQPYEMHVRWNSADLMAGINAKSNALVICINLFITIFTSSILLVTVLLTLLLASPFITLTAIIGFGFLYLCIVTFTNSRLVRNGKVMAVQHAAIARYLSESLGGIRDVLLDGTQEIYCRNHKIADSEFRRAEGSNSFLGQSPRYAVEMVGMLAIIGAAYFLAFYSNSGVGAIPILGVFVLGAQKLLPSLQQIYGSWAGIQANKTYFLDALDFLDLPLPNQYELRNKSCSLDFKCSIDLVNISYRYAPGLDYVLKNINLTIYKGSRIGFIGKTGSGKSTLLDIVMGLLTPTCGEIKVDGQVIDDENREAWRGRIAHVPQSIFLSDNSIAENIALGIDLSDIDFDRVKNAAKKAQLDETIGAWPEGYMTRVGERGIRLSGGQKQRIGIARALYRGKEIIILDEATSALDAETEADVMKSIEILNKENMTVLMIAHRLTTLKSCSSIIKIENGSIIAIGSYQDIVA